MFNKIDLFGSQILLRFKSDHTYNTKFGSFFTLIIIGFIGFRLFFIIKDVFERTSPQVIYNERQVDDPELFKVTKDSFPMAFGMQHPISYEPYIDEGIYTVKALQQIKRLVYNEDTKIFDSVWERKQINVQPCVPENFGNPDNASYYLKLKYTQMYCFPPDVVLQMNGDFNSQVFSNIRLNVQKCAGNNCKSDDVIKFYLEKGSFAMQLSDVYVDPTIKSYPFKSYSRDMFFPTSTKMPKDVNIYMRNNYIFSDFGWVMEDIRQQSFPSFSFYEASVYPESYQTYFLQVVMRFEKQKENVYQRKYKNLNNILSEIGGFTQSLLAIGLLICTRVSQLQLNQEIINQAFNYEDCSTDKSDQDNLENELKSTPKRPINNTPFLIESKMSQDKRQFHFSQNNILNVSKVQLNQNDNLLSMSNLKRSEMNMNNMSMNIDPNQNNNPPSNVQSFNQIDQKAQKLINPNVRQYKQQQQVKQSNQQDGKQSQMKHQKQILNYLIQDIQYNNQANLELAEGISPEEERISKLKQKIILQEQRAKENSFKKLMEKQTNSMSMSVWEYFKSSIWPFGQLKHKQQIIDYSIDKLYQNLDIFNIMKRLIEVEKLKRLLLDQEQIKLFDYLPKPTIRSDIVLNQMSHQYKQNEIDVLYQDSRTEMQKTRDAFQAYQIIVNKPHYSVLDQKLIDLLDPNLIDIFAAQTRNQSQELDLQRVQYIKEDNLDQFSSHQHYLAAQQDYVVQQQDVSILKNEDKLLKQEVLSPRINISPEPILSNISSHVQEQTTTHRLAEYNHVEQEINDNNKNTSKIEKQQEIEKSNVSSIESEQGQQMPNELVKQSKPSQTSFEES